MSDFHVYVYYTEYNSYRRFKSRNRRAKRKIARAGLSYAETQKDISKVYLDIQKALSRGDVTSVRGCVTEKFERKMIKLCRKNRRRVMCENVELLSVQAVYFKKKRLFEKICFRIEGKCAQCDDCEPEFFAQYCVFIKNDQERWRLHSIRRPFSWDRSIYSGRYG